LFFSSETVAIFARLTSLGAFSSKRFSSEIFLTDTG
jgi:hypothetical protein